MTSGPACCQLKRLKAIKGVAPEDNRPVVMTGDGINDAPSLTAADVGIAMGAKGATAASESADVVIMTDDISKINDAVAISKHTMKVAEIDVIIAIVVVILLEAGGLHRLDPSLLGRRLAGSGRHGDDLPGPFGQDCTLYWDCFCGNQCFYLSCGFARS
jgi:hypothetical protein